MSNKELFTQYSQYEDILIQQFNDHSFYKKLPTFTKEQFKAYLLQLGFLSLEFVKFIEQAKLAMQSEKGKEAVRHILRDEIPAKGPTHQDNRITDLRKCGIALDEILNVSKSEQTKKVLTQYYQLIQFPQDNYDLKVLVALRFLGEILVGETYRHVVVGLKKHFNVDPHDSLFYTFHWQHDQKGGSGDQGGSGHTEYYDQAVSEVLSSEMDLDIAKQTAQKCLQIRCSFHEQFL